MLEKITNAIILAAGRGERLKPYTDTTPKPLLPVNNEPMLETLIKQLYLNEIEHISIVVGYMAEKFEYLKSKYNIEIIENPAYISMNNISSLYRAKDKLNQPTMILDADLIINDTSILRKYISKSGYSCYWTDEKIPEWGLRLSYSDIIGCNRNFAKNCYALKTLSFWTKEDCEKLKSILTINFVIKHQEKYWDDIPLFICADEFSLCAYKISKDALTEIDTAEEYERLL